MNKKGWIILISVVLVICCCASVVGAGVGGYLFYNNSNFDRLPASNVTSVSPRATRTAASPTLTPRPVVRATLPAPSQNISGTTSTGSVDNVDALASASLPREDLRELAVRFKGVPEAATKVTCDIAAPEYEIGATRTFTLSNQDDDTQFQVTARLDYKTAHTYMWVEQKPEQVRLNSSRLKTAADTFENDIYKVNREFFGSEATPGVDCDGRLYILHATGIGSTVGGYFSSPDGFPKAVRSDSNEAEMFVIHAAPGYNGSDPGSSSYMSTLAHEFQHMISYNTTHASNLWLEEGAAQLAERLNGYADDIGTVYDFASAPETQLNTWSESSAGENSAHYGGGYLFWSYLYDRFGEEIAKKLARNPERSAAAFMKVLADEGVVNPDTNEAFRFEDLFADFVVANFMNQTKIEETGNRYNYETIKVPPMTTRGTFSAGDYPIQMTENLNQFGTHYYELSGDSEVTIDFTGSTVVPLLPMPSGKNGPDGTFWYSNRGDASNPRLTREMDLSSLKAGDTATLRFRAWYRMEKDYDYAYASVSEDGGTTWSLLGTSTCTTANPQNANLGCGWTGPSNPTGDTNEPQWMDEEADLSAYAGKTILLRFETVTDAGVNRDGLAIDNIEVPEINFTDAADSDDGWQAEGFSRVVNVLPQAWRVQVVLENKDGSRSVEHMTLADAAGALKVNFGGDIERAILMVSPTTQVTTEPGSYELRITQ